jgi:hypothetical protein
MTMSRLLSPIPREDRRHSRTEVCADCPFGFEVPWFRTPVDMGDGSAYVGRLAIEDLTEQ